MGQVSQIMWSSLLITSLGCGGLPHQARTPIVAPTPDMPDVVQAPAADALGAASIDLSVDDHDHGLVPVEPLLDDPDETASAVSDEAMASDRDPLGPMDIAPRVLRLYDLHDRTVLELSVSEDGSVAETDRLQMEYFFRCRRTQQTHEMAKGVLKILYAVDRAFPGHLLEIVSGFRTYPFGVRDSKHYEGHAIDLRVRGVRTSRVRDFVWKHFADVGVGYYGHENFVHVDYRPEEKDTAWTSPEPNAAYAYNPSWALRIRPPWRAPRALPASSKATLVARAM